MGILSNLGDLIIDALIWLDGSTVGGFFLALAVLYLTYKLADATSTEAHRLVTSWLNRKGRK